MEGGICHQIRRGGYHSLLKRIKRRGKRIRRRKGVHLSFIGAGVERVYKALLICSNMMLLADEMYGKNVTKE